MSIERPEVWVFMMLIFFILICIAIDSYTRLFDIKKKNSRMKASMSAQKAMIEKLKAENIMLSKRCDSFKLIVADSYKDQIEVLKAEIAKKDMMLQQKWKAVAEDVQN